MLLAPTLIWMLICGGCPCGCSDCGALGFSNEKSLVYCAKTLSWGGAPDPGGLPLPLVMKLVSRIGPTSGQVANIALPASTRTPQDLKAPVLVFAGLVGFGKLNDI